MGRGEVPARDGLIRAARFSVGVAAAAVVFLIAASLWIGTCGGATFDVAACGTPQRTFLAFGAPMILLCGALRAFARTYQIWRQRSMSWPWHGAGWFLMAATLLVLAKSMPLVAVA
ncbi:hypothetical protein [Mycobacterium sp. 1274761.0]|uniref:hypothetical protein n=1 Tax=Mycobacterium sp. 1274761.0 TaxID=1834077 RepID=UPI001E4C70DA|nr:hypothetical protein [Mycobacterium sp. 1274761.0]